MKSCGCSALNHQNHIGHDCTDPGLPEFDGFCKECKMENDTDDSIDYTHSEKKKTRESFS